MMMISLSGRVLLTGAGGLVVISGIVVPRLVVLPGPRGGDELPGPGDAFSPRRVLGLRRSIELILRCPWLTPGAKLLALQLLWTEGGKTETWPTQQTLAAAVGMSFRQVRRYLSELRDKAIIETTQRGRGRSNLCLFQWQEDVFNLQKCADASTFRDSDKWPDSGTYSPKSGQIRSLHKESESLLKVKEASEEGSAVVDPKAPPAFFPPQKEEAPEPPEQELELIRLALAEHAEVLGQQPDLALCRALATAAGGPKMAAARIQRVWERRFSPRTPRPRPAPTSFGYWLAVMSWRERAVSMVPTRRPQADSQPAPPEAVLESPRDGGGLRSAGSIDLLASVAKDGRLPGDR